MVVEARNETTGPENRWMDAYRDFREVKWNGLRSGMGWNESGGSGGPGGRLVLTSG